MASGFEEGARRVEVVLRKLQAAAKQGQRRSSRLVLQSREIALGSGCVAQFEMSFGGAFERSGGFRRVEIGGEQAVAESLKHVLVGLDQAVAEQGARRVVLEQGEVVGVEDAAGSQPADAGIVEEKIRRKAFRPAETERIEIFAQSGVGPKPARPVEPQGRCAGASQ